MITLPSSPAPAPAPTAAHSRHPPPPTFLTSSHSRHLLSHSTTRRSSLLLLLLPLAVSPTPPTTAAIPSPATLDLYTDTVQGFSLLKPASWVKVDKAGATALFEEEGKGSNSIGVVVSPVRLSSLRDFGTPEFVADKLIQAERRCLGSESSLGRSPSAGEVPSASHCENWNFRFNYVLAAAVVGANGVRSSVDKRKAPKMLR